MSRCTTRPAHSTPAANSTNHAPDRPDAGIHPDAHPETSTPHRTLSEMFFRPFPELPPEWQSPKAQDTLLREYVNHRGNFADFALDRGISIDQLYDWLHSEQVIEKCKRLEAMANRQSALLATLIRPDALKALADVIISPDSTPSQRRLAASAVLRACDKLNKPSRQPSGRGTSARGADFNSRFHAPSHEAPPDAADNRTRNSRIGGDSDGELSPQSPSTPSSTSPRHPRAPIQPQPRTLD